MPLSRLITLIIGISIVIGLMLWLVAAIYNLYTQIAWTSPLLANLLVFLIIVVMIVLICVFFYYYAGFNDNPSKRRKSSSRKSIRIPAEKSEAASTNILAVRKQLSQIEDKVAQTALLNKSKEIEQNLIRKELRVVVFGTGSAGKTSLVNALIGETVGEINATMGTTQVGQTYRLKLQGLSREILITDTPGILEAGEMGSERQQLAADLATKADLLLFVVDNDLLQSEYEPLRTLAEIGKRSILVFNKTDVYTDEDKEEILEILRQRVRGIISGEDVIPVAANPQPVEFSAGEIIQPSPEIYPLIKRLAGVIRAEGDDLLADNILLQSQRLGEEARQLIDKQQRKEADKIISRYQWVGAGVIAVTPLPVVDMLAAAAVNAQMVVEIGKVYGCELNQENGRDLALSLGKTLVSLGVVKGAVDLIAKALQFHIATYAVGKVIQAVSAAYLTRIAGRSFIEYFSHDRDWGDGGITEVVQRQFKLTRKDEFVKAFIQDAIARVVEPLQEEYDGNLPVDDWDDGVMSDSSEVEDEWLDWLETHDSYDDDDEWK